MGDLRIAKEREPLARKHASIVWATRGKFLEKHGLTKDDLSQELQAEMIKSARKYQKGRGTQLRTWLIGAMRLASQRIVGNLHAQKLSNGWIRKPLEGLAASGPSPSKLAENSEAREILLDAVRTMELPGQERVHARNREVFINLHGLEDRAPKRAVDVARNYGLSQRIVQKVSKEMLKLLAEHPKVLSISSNQPKTKPSAKKTKNIA